jgi:hypothetical protein
MYRTLPGEDCRGSAPLAAERDTGRRLDQGHSENGMKIEIVHCPT